MPEMEKEAERKGCRVGRGDRRREGQKERERERGVGEGLWLTLAGKVHHFFTVRSREQKHLAVPM